MTGVMLFANIASIIADEHGAQQACKSTLFEPSGVDMRSIISYQLSVVSC